MTTVDSELGPRLAEGKTKIIYASAQPDLVYMVHKDAITAGDGAKRDVIADKGALSCRTTSAVFRYLERHGVATHYVETLDEHSVPTLREPSAHIGYGREPVVRSPPCASVPSGHIGYGREPQVMLVRRAAMIPIEWVARRLATGSYVRRTGTAEGTRFDPIVRELFLKDDARHDPQITADEAVALGLCSEAEVAAALAATERVFLLLEDAWAAQGIQLVDLKIELGRVESGDLVVADVIDNDSWRLWPGGRRELMLDKQVYRDLASADAAALEDVRQRYAEVARRVERFDAL